MRLTSLQISELEMAALALESGCLPIGRINQARDVNFATDIFDIIRRNQLPRLKNWYISNRDKIGTEFKDEIIPYEEVNYAPLYHHPSKIWGIGLNYQEHAKDLEEQNPQDIPASFMKASTTIIGHKDTIKIPKMSHKTTGEAELGIIIGSQCKNVSKEHWLDVVAGFTSIIDMTAEDILRKNPRYLTVSKNFDTFFSFGPQILTIDEIHDLDHLKVRTIINGNVHAENSIVNMTFSPASLVSFHSQVMTLMPGDIIATGTPRAVELHDGDVIGCEIDGFPTLENPVTDLKN